jgi:ribosome maturation protein SDO1
MIRYTISNRKFEIACYRNKALNWRSGTETDLDEVLQTNDIYSNVSQGELASKEDLEKYFPKMTRPQILKTVAINPLIPSRS